MTRDYSLHIDRTARDGAPLLSVLGGKITTYRALAQTVIERLAPWFPALRPAWTARVPLPGADLGPSGYAGLRRSLLARWPQLDPRMLDGLARSHGTLTETVLDGATTPADLGRHFGEGLYQREVDYLYRREWVAGLSPAAAVQTILWRRTKCGLLMTDEEREAILSYVSDCSNLPGRTGDAAAIRVRRPRSSGCLRVLFDIDDTLTTDGRHDFGLGGFVDGSTEMLLERNCAVMSL